MSLRTIKNKFRQPLYKDDLKYVLLNGIVAMIFVSIAMGIVEAFLAKINFPFSICVYLIGFLIGRQISKHYYTYHIWYPTLAVIFTIIGYIIFNAAFIGVIIGNFNYVIKYIFSLDFLIYTLTSINPINGINSFLNLLVLALTVVTSFRIASRRR